MRFLPLALLGWHTETLNRLLSLGDKKTIVSCAVFAFPRPQLIHIELHTLLLGCVTCAALQSRRPGIGFWGQSQPEEHAVYLVSKLHNVTRCVSHTVQENPSLAWLRRLDNTMHDRALPCRCSRHAFIAPSAPPFPMFIAPPAPPSLFPFSKTSISAPRPPTRTWCRASLCKHHFTGESFAVLFRKIRIVS